MIADIVTAVVDASSNLLAALPNVFSGVIELVYDSGLAEITSLGNLILAAAGFALAWAGIRFIFGFVTRMLNKTRGGAR